ncbi:FIST signal transduction protein [Pseudoroseomonas globiformis]|uniref:FIST signal transduction protein n=1 Tax=Teichococcus globiformis TaxID=2307229 RepID=A0ABV7FU84_9PROT
MTLALETRALIEVGYARDVDAAMAARACARAVGANGKPDLILAFCGGKLQPETVMGTLRQELGEVTVVGGASAGGITRAGHGYSGLELVTVGFSGAEVVPQVVLGDLSPGDVGGGEALGARVREVATEGAVVLLLFDSVASQMPLRLHPASRIVEGFHKGLNGHRVTLLGGGMLTDMNLSDSFVFDGRDIRHHMAVALVFPPGMEAETAILHGCRPISTFMEITRIDGMEVYELDGEPALTVIERMLGLPLGQTERQELSLIATLGQKQGDPFAPYDENAYVNRLILRASPDTGSVTLFEPDFFLGARVQIMARDNALMLDSARNGVARLNGLVEGGDNLLALYIDCAGRASARSGALTEEAEMVLQGFTPTMPFAGFYSGVEIAPFQGYSRPLDWTGVLAVLRRRRRA